MRPLSIVSPPPGPGGTGGFSSGSVVYARLPVWSRRQSILAVALYAGVLFWQMTLTGLYNRPYTRTTCLIMPTGRCVGVWVAARNETRHVGLLRVYTVTRNCPVFIKYRIRGTSIRLTNHRRWNSVNFGARHFWPKIYVWKSTKCPNFTRYLPEKYFF